MITPFARLKKARTRLLMDEPFFGSLMLHLTPVEDPSVKRLSTDGNKLWYNPEYLATLEDGPLRTLLAHEALHPGLLHPFRLGKRDLRQANIAADYVINNFLDKYNQEAKARDEVIPFPWPKTKDDEPDVLLDHKYDGMSFEEVYDALSKKPKEEDKPQSPPKDSKKPSQPVGQGQGKGAKPDKGAGAAEPGNQPGNGQLAPNGQPGGDGDEPGSPGEFIRGAVDEADAQAQEAKWKVAIKQAVMMAKGQGRLPAEMERMVGELIDPKASWREILRTLLTSAAKDDYTWTRPNPRYTGRGLILPSLHVPRMGTIAVAIDTSGSVDEEQMNEFMSEVRSILFDCRPEKMILTGCDSRIHEWLEIDPFDEVPLALHGGGGTNFRPVFERLALEPEPPAGLVYLTDLDGRFPDEAPAYPVIWACNTDRQAPFGETINL